MPDPVFRYARRDDARAIVDLIETAYRGPDLSERWDSEAHLLRGPRTSLSEVQGLLADPDSRFVVAEAGGRIAACALIQRRGTTSCHRGGIDQPAAYFGMFAVSPDAREGGMGKKVLAECEQRARDLWDSPAMVMTVISVRETLMDWYRRRGYRATGVRLPFPFTETSGETTRDFDLVEMLKVFD